MAKFLDGAGLATLWEQIKNTATKFEHGSYVGTGSKSKTLTFDFEPKLVHISSGNGDALQLIRGRTIGIVYVYDSHYFLSLAWSDNSVTFQARDNATADKSLNGSSYTYHYVAIG